MTEPIMRDIGDVVIVRGDAAGGAVAYYLSQAGVKARLIELEGIGLQASGYSAGPQGESLKEKETTCKLRNSVLCKHR